MSGRYFFLSLVAGSFLSSFFSSFLSSSMTGAGFEWHLKQSSMGEATLAWHVPQYCPEMIFIMFISGLPPFFCLKIDSWQETQSSTCVCVLCGNFTSGGGGVIFFP